jgi:hypothetical protein
MIATMAKRIGHLPQLPIRIPQGSSSSPLMIINSLQTITTSLMGCRNLRNIARKGNMLPRILIIITLNKSQARDMSHRKKLLSQMPIIVTEALRTLSSLKPVLPLVVVVAITHSTIRITIIRISPQESWREVHRRRWMTTGQCSPNNSTRGGRRRT